MSDNIYKNFTVEEINNFKKFVIDEGLKLQGSVITSGNLGKAICGVYNRRLKKCMPIEINALTAKYPTGIPAIVERIINMSPEIFASYEKMTVGAGSHA